MGLTSSAPVNEWVRGCPAPALRRFVASYDGYRQRGLQPALHRGLPSPFLTVSFTLDEPLNIAQHVDPRQPPGRYDSLIGGLHTSPALISHDGTQSGIRTRLSPLAARALLGVPAGELAAIDLHASDLLGSVAADIHQRLQEATTWPERFAVIDEALRRRLSNEREVPAEVRHAWGRLLRTGGMMPVSALADEVGWGDTHLANRFRSEVGLSPKTAARVIRFHRARQMIPSRAAGRPLLADVAADCGYYDQSHLAREFTALAGCPPSRWLAEEFGNIQATSVGEG